MGLFDDLKTNEEQKMFTENTYNELKKVELELYNKREELWKSYYYSNEISQKLHSAIQNLYNGFKTYFANKGFKVSEIDNHHLTATFGGVTVNLTRDQSTIDSFFLEIPYKYSFEIYITESDPYHYDWKFKGHMESNGIINHYSLDANKIPFLEKQIEFLNQDIAGIQKQLEQASEVEFIYQLSGKDNNKEGKYTNIEDLLNDI